MLGYSGRIGIVDLTAGTTRAVDVEEGFARRWLGGNGFAAKIIQKLVAPDVDPFAPENVVVFALGPLTGAPFWGSNRGLVASISPMTNGFLESVYGGDFAWALKRTGWDAVVIRGCAEQPVYLRVESDGITVVDASDLWGLGVEESMASIRDREAKGAECAVIGPAGEHRVAYGNVMCSGKRQSAAGRGGMGSVLGSKRCKALVAKGDRAPEFHDVDRVKSLFDELKPELVEKASGLKDMGTPMLVNMINGRGMLCTLNNRTEVFEGAERISGEVIRDEYKQRNLACRGCGVACGKLVSVPGGRYTGRSVKMPEYETLYAIGSMLGNDDLVSVFNANALCDDMGMDTISFGVSLAFLVECADVGLFPSEGLRFGPQGENLPGFVEATAYRRGRTGEYLAMGSTAASREIGPESARLLYAAKGLEIAGHSARGLRMAGVSYATSHRGGSHHDGRPVYLPDDPERDPGFSDMVDLSHATFNNCTIGDCLVLCRFVHERTFGKELTEKTAELVRALTGWEDYTLEELTTTAERVCTLERLLSVERGLSRDDDTLPYRVRTTPIPDGPAAGRYCSDEDLARMLDEYYQLRAWDREGVPTADTLERLGIHRGDASELGLA